MDEQALMGGGYSVFHDTMVDMTYPEVAEAAEQGAVLLWGLGVIEEHGPHLPLGTDVYIPAALLRRVRQLLKEMGVRSVTMPPFYWGVNQVTGVFPGSFVVRPEIMAELMIDLIKSVKKDGFKNLFCVSGHGDALHNRTILDGVRRGAEAASINAYFVGAPSFIKRLGFDPADPHVVQTASEVERKSEYFDIHAGEFESSYMGHLYPDLVRTGIMRTLKSTDFTIDDLMEWRKGGEHAQRRTPRGYLGDPAAADANKGGEMLQMQAELVAAAIAAKLRA